VRRTTYFPVDWEPTAANLADHILEQDIDADTQYLAVKGFDLTAWRTRKPFGPAEMLRISKAADDITKNGYFSDYSLRAKLHSDALPLDFALNLELGVLDAPWTVARLDMASPVLHVYFAAPGLWSLLNATNTSVYLRLRALNVSGLADRWKAGEKIP
jgi:hypothetical protein